MQDACRRYFHPQLLGGSEGMRSGGFLVIIVGIITMFFSGFVSGLIVAGIGFGICCMGFNGSEMESCTDAEYDKAIEEYLPTIKERALTKLGVDEDEVKEIPPIIMGDYVYPKVDVEKNADGKVKVTVHGELKKGDDSKWRSAEYKVVMLFFSQNELHCYSRTFSTATKNVSAEITEVYFYQDIVSASTATFQDNFKDAEGKEITVTREGFSLTTKGGTSFTVNVANAQYAQQSVNAMRALLREKKQG